MGRQVVNGGTYMREPDGVKRSVEINVRVVVA